MNSILEKDNFKKAILTSVVLGVLYFAIGKNLLLAIAGAIVAFTVTILNLKKVFRSSVFSNIILLLCSPFYFYFIVEILNHHFPWKGEPIAIFFNILLYATFVVVGWVLTNNVIVGCAIVSVVVFILGTVNYFVQIYRDAAFSVYDILAFKTAMNVLRGGMELQTDWVMAVGCIGFFTYWLCLYKLYVKKNKIAKTIDATSKKVRIYNISFRTLTAITLFIFYVFIFRGNLMENNGVEPNVYHGNEVNGFLVHFIVSYKAGRVEEPYGYNAEEINKFIKQYPNKAETDKEIPNIIVIMNESFADYRVFDKCTTDKPFMPFFDSLKENTVKGFALTSVHGGGTANSEWEFLMGNTMAFMPKSSVPYQIYLNSPKSSLTNTLKEKGYTTFAMHPYESSGWNRKKAWQNLGFEKMYFIEDFMNYEMISDKMLDKSNYEAIIQKYEEKEFSAPFFLYNVTIQNHTGGFYDAAEILGDSIKFTGDLAGKNPYEEGYFALIHESDKALEYLVNYFKTVDEKTVIMMYGDHQPGAGEAFLEQAFGQPTQTVSVEERMKMYKVPFVIWANYDIEEREYELTSLNYLSSILLDSIGLTGSAYNNYLIELMEEYPAINAFGYYKNNVFHEITDYKALDEVRLQQYQQLQYNNMFDENAYQKEFFE